jgi:hypothetical protein
MNRVITTIIFTLASFVALNGAVAQKHAVRVFIPFDFTASGTQMSAGSYTIATEGSFTLMTKNSTGESKFVRSIPFIDNSQDDSKLIFSTYGDQHFLRKILCPGVDMTLELLPSKPEIRARELAVNNSGN